MRGIPASPGISIGKAYLKQERTLDIEEREIPEGKVEEEIIRLHNALDSAKNDIKGIKKFITRELGKEQAEIFQAHIMLLKDPELVPAIENKIREEHINAEAAVNQVLGRYAAIFAGMKDEYMRGRKCDINDVGKRIISSLNGKEVISEELPGKVILVARDLSPSDTANLDRSKIQAFVTAQGSRTSHTAIMARSLGIPAVVGVGEELLKNCRQGDTIIVDGNQGKIIIDPDQENVQEYHQRWQDYRQSQKKLKQFKDEKAETADGVEIEIAGNIGELADLEAILERGGEGIGLFRTEFLYMNREELPSEEEQYRVYRQVVEEMDGKSVIIRTLDIGGGKDLPYLELPAGKNPVLGYRAIRICLDRPQIFIPQLKAILRAAVHGNLKLMYPMISSVEEICAANQILDEAKSELKQEGKTFREDIEVGIMIEIPSTLMIADVLARKVDFFSIGTNDLIQYLVAADRNNEQIADIHSPYHPAVLRFIKKIVDICHERGIWVGMCGEAAGDELLLPFHVGIGLDELSMSAISILPIKHLLSYCSLKDARKLVAEVLSLETMNEVRELLEEYHSKFSKNF